MAKEKTNSSQTETQNKKSDKPKKASKFQTKYTVFYGLIAVLAVCTVIVAYQGVNYFVLGPMSFSGAPVYGYRTEGLPEILESDLTKTTEFAKAQDNVKDASIKVSGPVIYINVLVNEETELEAAKSAATKTADQLLETVKLEDEKTLYDAYDLQLVVYNKDPETLRQENRDAELEYITEFDTAIVEEIVAHAEAYPTAETIDRAKRNIALLRDGEVKDAFNARVGELTEWTAEKMEEVGEIPEKVVNQDIPQSDLASYPSWGTYSPQTDKYVWK